MDLTRNGPIALAENRLAWLDTRQRILARNVANADTPGFRPSDAVPFQEVLQHRRPAAGFTRVAIRLDVFLPGCLTL